MLCAARRLSPLMRIRISHLTRYRYETPATSVIQILRLTPRRRRRHAGARGPLPSLRLAGAHQRGGPRVIFPRGPPGGGPPGALAGGAGGGGDPPPPQGFARAPPAGSPPSLYLRATALTSP